MRRIFYYGIIFVVLSSFTSLSETIDIKPKVEVNLKIGDWIAYPVKYTGTVEIIFTGDENASIIVNKLEMFESQNILWETNISEELKGIGEDYYIYKNAVESYVSKVKLGASQVTIGESYKIIERLAPKIYENTYRIKVPIDPNRIFSENEFKPGSKKEITFILKFIYNNEIYEITKLWTIEIREPFPKPPTLKSQNSENLVGAGPAGWYFGDLHVHSEYTDCDSAANGDETIAERKYRAQSILGWMSWLSITDHSYCFDSTSEWTTKVYQDSINYSDSSFIILPSEELSVSEDCPDGTDDETLCQIPPLYCTGDAAHLGANSLSSFIQNTWGSCPVGSSGRCPASPGSQQGINLTNSQGFSIINHPIASAWDWESINCTSGETGIEIWNGYFCNNDLSAVSLWKNLLLSGQKLYAYAGGDIEAQGSDICRYDNDCGLPCPFLGVVFNNVWADSYDRTGLVNALKRGSLYVSNHAALTIGTNLSIMGGEGNITLGQSVSVSGYFASNYSGTVRVYKGVIGNLSETQVWSGTPNPYYSFTDYPTSKSYYRAEFHSDDNTKHAFTNPVWVNVVAQTLYTEKNIKENEEGMRGVRK